METSKSTDPLAQLLSHADPAQNFHPSEGDATRLLRAVTKGQPRSVSHRRRAAAVVAAVSCLVVVGVGVPGVAAANGYLAHTGWFSPDPNPGSTPSVSRDTDADYSEWIEIQGSDYVEVATSEWPSYVTLPPNYEQKQFARSIAENTVRLDREENGGQASLRQVTGIRREFEAYARCAWRSEWLAANSAKSVARQRHAAEMLQEAAHWPATVATDGGGVVEAETAVADAARRGDRGQVLEPDLGGCDEMLAQVGR